MSITKIHTDEVTGAKVYRDSEYKEFQVVPKDEQRGGAGTYYTDDKADAIATAKLLN